MRSRRRSGAWVPGRGRAARRVPRVRARLRPARPVLRAPAAGDGSACVGLWRGAGACVGDISVVGRGVGVRGGTLGQSRVGRRGCAYVVAPFSSLFLHLFCVGAFPPVVPPSLHTLHPTPRDVGCPAAASFPWHCPHASLACLPTPSVFPALPAGFVRPPPVSLRSCFCSPLWFAHRLPIRLPRSHRMAFLSCLCLVSILPAQTDAWTEASCARPSLS